MGYLDGSTVTVDAILTKHGRLKLAEGGGLGITKFALSDDGVNYNLWNNTHESGSANYGEAITNLPNLEAVPDDTVMMRYTLSTQDRSTIYGAYIKLAQSSFTITDQGGPGKIIIAPNSVNTAEETYKFTIFDASGLILPHEGQHIGGSHTRYLNRAQIPDQRVLGPLPSLELRAKPTDKAISTTIGIYGWMSGAMTFVEVKIKPNVKKYTTA